MTEIGDGLWVDLSRVSAIQDFGDSVHIYIDGKIFEWKSTFQMAMQLIEIKQRASSVNSQIP